MVDGPGHVGQDLHSLDPRVVREQMRVKDVLVRDVPRLRQVERGRSTGPGRARRSATPSASRRSASGASSRPRGPCPVATHRATVSRSAADRLLCWIRSPPRGTPYHGGMRPSPTTSAIVVRLGLGLLVGEQRERGRGVRLVALHAMLLQDRSDVVGIRDRLVGRVRGRFGDDAAVHRRRRHRDRLAGEDRVEGLGQVVPGRLRALPAGPVLVVDPAAVLEDALPVEDHDLRRAGDADRVGDPTVGVLDERELDPVLDRLRRPSR